jgi:hypothetical protein
MYVSLNCWFKNTQNIKIGTCTWNLKDGRYEKKSDIPITQIGDEVKVVGEDRLQSNF